jgi:hypothetical protein
MINAKLEMTNGKWQMENNGNDKWKMVRLKRNLILARGIMRVRHS